MSETNNSNTIADQIADLRTKLNCIDSMVYDLWVDMKKKDAPGKLL